MHRLRELGLHTSLAILSIGAMLLGACDWVHAQALNGGLALEQTTEHETQAKAYLVQAESGDREAQFKVAGRYERGQGIVKNLQQAIYWYERAADQGSVNAQYAIGLRYLNGVGLTRDFEKAHFWLDRAAKLGLADAQEELARLYELGAGVETSAQKATSWRNAAANQRDSLGKIDPQTASPSGKPDIATNARNGNEFTSLLNEAKGMHARDLAIQDFLHASGEVAKAESLSTLLEICMFITDQECFANYFDLHGSRLPILHQRLPNSTSEEKDLVLAVMDGYLSKYVYRLAINPIEKHILSHLEFVKDRVVGGTKFQYVALKTVLESKIAALAGKRDLARKLLRRGRALLLSRNLNLFPEQLTLANLVEVSGLNLNDSQDVTRLLRAFRMTVRETGKNLDAYFNPYVAVRLYRTIYEVGVISDADRQQVVKTLHGLYQILEVPHNSNLSAEKESFYALLAIDKYWGSPVELTFDPKLELAKYAQPKSLAGITVKFLLDVFESRDTPSNPLGVEQALTWFDSLRKTLGPAVGRQYDPIYDFLSALRFRAKGDRHNEIESLNRYAKSQIAMYRESGLGLLDNPPVLNRAMTKAFRYVVSRFLEIAPESYDFKQLAYFAIITFNAVQDADTQASYAMLSEAGSDLQTDQIQFYIRVKKAYDSATFNAYYLAARAMIDSRDVATYSGGVGPAAFTDLLDRSNTVEMQLKNLNGKPNPFVTLDFKRLIPLRPNEHNVLIGLAEGYGLAFVISQNGSGVRLFETWQNRQLKAATEILGSRALENVSTQTLKKNSAQLSTILLGNGFNIGSQVRFFTGATVLGVPNTLLSNPKTGNWLLEDVAVSAYVSVYQSSRPQSNLRRERPVDFVAFANPSLRTRGDETSTSQLASLIRGKRGGVESLSELPETESEAKELAKSFAGEKKFFFGKHANFDNLLSFNWDRVKFLSLSTHGVLAGEIDGALSSSLVLSPTEKNSGLIPAEWLFALAGSPQFVLLSTCNSGTAALPLDRSEIDSLASAFLLKGTQAVVSSYWQVDSLGTTELFTRLSAAMGMGKSFSVAFLDSVREMMRDDRWSHPSIWAAFTLVGSEYGGGITADRRPSLTMNGTTFNARVGLSGHAAFSVSHVGTEDQSWSLSEIYISGSEKEALDRVKRQPIPPEVTGLSYSSNSVFGELKALHFPGEWRFFKIDGNKESFVCSLTGLSNDWLIGDFFLTATHIFSVFVRQAEDELQTVIGSQSISGCSKNLRGPISYKGGKYAPAHVNLFPLIDGSRVVYSEGIYRDDKERVFQGPSGELGVRPQCAFDIWNNFHVLGSDLSIQRTSRFANLQVVETEMAATRFGVSVYWLNPCSRTRKAKILSEDWFFLDDYGKKEDSLFAPDRPLSLIESLINQEFSDITRFWWRPDARFLYVFGSPGYSTDFYQGITNSMEDARPYNGWARAMSGLYAYDRETMTWQKVSSTDQCEFPQPLGYSDKSLVLCNKLSSKGTNATISLLPVH